MKKDQNHEKQVIAAVITGVLFAALFGVLAAVYLSIKDLPFIIRAGYGGLMIAMAVGMIHVLKERILEIRKGENDDLSNY